MFKWYYMTTCKIQFAFHLFIHFLMLLAHLLQLNYTSFWFKITHFVFRWYFMPPRGMQLPESKFAPRLQNLQQYLYTQCLILKPRKKSPCDIDNTWCFKPSQPRRTLSGLKEAFMIGYLAKRTDKAELRPEKQREKAEICRESFWNAIHLKGP